MFQGFSQLSSLFAQARQMHGRMGELQEALKKIRVEGEAGGGMVVVEMNGQAQALRCRIDPSLIDSKDAEMIEDLVVVAVNQASERVKQAAQKEMEKLTEGVDMQGLQSMLSKFGLGPQE